MEDIYEYKKFTLGHQKCDKCGEMLASYPIKYIPATSSYTEHLEVKCTNCSYVWRMYCKKGEENISIVEAVTNILEEEGMDKVLIEKITNKIKIIGELK